MKDSFLIFFRGLPPFVPLLFYLLQEQYRAHEVVADMQSEASLPKADTEPNPEKARTPIAPAMRTVV